MEVEDSDRSPTAINESKINIVIVTTRENPDPCAGRVDLFCKFIVYSTHCKIPPKIEKLS